MCNVDDFDAIYLSACDPCGVGRGRFVFPAAYSSIFKNGLSVTQAALFCGVLYEIPIVFTDLKSEGWKNATCVPDIRSLKSFPWLSSKERKIGHMICDLYDLDGNLDEAMPRSAASKQLTKLKELGYEIIVEQDLEFHVCEKGTTTPTMKDLSSLIDCLQMSLKECNLAVSGVSQGHKQHILRVSMSGVEGMEAASNNHSVRYAIKSICAYQGYSVTFMTSPFPDSGSTGYTVRYWLRRADTGRNAFYDDVSQDTSEVACLWMKGQQRYTNEIYSFLRSTVNCYWGPQGDMYFHQQSNGTRENDTNQDSQTHGNSTVIVDSRPTSVSNPYNVLAALVAAGLAELTSSDSQPIIGQSDPPTKLQDALDHLTGSTFLVDNLGQMFVYRFSTLKREYEVLKFEQNSVDNPGFDEYSFSRKFYFHL